MRKMKKVQLTIIAISVFMVFGMNYTLAQTDSNNSAIMVSVGSINGTSHPNGTYTQTINFTGNVGKIQTGQSVVIKIFKNDLPYKTDLVRVFNTAQDNLFYYSITVEGKSGLDSYKIDFTYNNQTVERILPLAHTGIPPIPEFGSSSGMIILISIISVIVISARFRFTPKV